MQGLRMLISSLDTQPLYESCWLQRKCHQLSEMQQHIAQTYVPGKPETCYCMCEGAVTNTVRETLCVLHWTPTMCFYAFYSPAGLQDCVSACSCGERSQAWVEPNRVTPLLPAASLFSWNHFLLSTVTHSLWSISDGLKIEWKKRQIQWVLDTLCGMFAVPRMIKALAGEEDRRAGGITQTGRWLRPKVSFGHSLGRTV